MLFVGTTQMYSNRGVYLIPTVGYTILVTTEFSDHFRNCLGIACTFTFFRFDIFIARCL